MHIYFERKLVVSSGKMFDFNASRTDADLLIAGSTMSAIGPNGIDETNMHNFARLVQINIASAKSDGSCGNAVLNTIPDARPVIVPSTPAQPQNPQQEASVTSRVAFVIYLLGCAVLALLIGKF